MEELTTIGGARVGWVNASWPLAKLTVSATRLRLSGLVGRYDFQPAEVISLERYGSIPFFSSGLRIVHSRLDYPAKIIFWTLGSPEKLLERIRDIGFLPSGPASSEIQRRGFPLRWSAILLFVVAWNGLFLLDRALSHSRNQPGIYALLALLSAFLICWGIRVSPTFQRLVLRDGRSVAEIQAAFLLVQIVSSILLVVFTVLLLTHAFPG
jgi:hypothetical protein